MQVMVLLSLLCILSFTLGRKDCMVTLMNDYLNKFLDMFANVSEYFFISLMLGISVTFLVESWRKNLTYLLAAVAFGTVLGYGVQNVESISQFAVLATLFGTISGPASIAVIQKKTVIDLAGDLKDVAERATARKRQYTYPTTSIPPTATPKSNDARRLPTQGDPYD